MTIITGGLVSYGLWGILPCLEGGERPCDWSYDGIVATLAAVLLWACPNPKKAFEKEGHPEEQHAVSVWERIKPRRNIFAHLIGGSVEWRRGTMELSKTINSKNHVGLPTTGGFWSHARMRYLGGIVALALSISILIEGGGGSRETSRRNRECALYGVFVCDDLCWRCLSQSKEDQRELIVSYQTSHR